MAKLNNKDFARLFEFITGEFGFKMPDLKRIMLQSRLQKRVKDLGYTNFSDYIDYFFSKKGMEEEFMHMIDIVSTNKTDFFRENEHFEYMMHTLLPDLYPNGKKGNLKFWSAGCSSGEEPYSLAMVLAEYRIGNPLIDEVYPTPFVFDVVFYQNVLIYFDRGMQEKIILKLCSRIKNEGYLFLGHSESIAGLNLPLKHIQPTIFMKT